MHSSTDCWKGWNGRGSMRKWRNALRQCIWKENNNFFVLCRFMVKYRRYYMCIGQTSTPSDQWTVCSKELLFRSLTIFYVSQISQRSNHYSSSYPEANKGKPKTKQAAVASVRVSTTCVPATKHNSKSINDAFLLLQCLDVHAYFPKICLRNEP